MKTEEMITQTNGMTNEQFYGFIKMLIMSLSMSKDIKTIIKGLLLFLPDNDRNDIEEFITQ